jgi:RHS repeat-associated protein
MRHPLKRLALLTLLLVVVVAVSHSLAFVCTAIAERRAGVSAHSTTVVLLNKQRVVASYGKLPLIFEANQGQTDAQVRFLARGSGYGLFLTRRGEAVLALGKPRSSHAALHSFDLLSSANKAGARTTNSPDVMRIKLVGGNPTPQVKGSEELPGKSNYFISSDAKKWRTNVPTYAKVKYGAVYPGVDLVYYGNQRQLEHDFMVSPGADPSVITLGFEGAEKLFIDTQGNLVISSKKGRVSLERPAVYQEIAGVRLEIAGRYVFKGKNQVGFEILPYDVSKPLVIDPVLVYSTYLGGSSSDGGLGIAVDSSGNAYVTGTTTSTNFPTTLGAFRRTSGGGFDAFVTKLNAAGSGLIYSTYLVGGGGSFFLGPSFVGIAVDSSGNAYVTGTTASTDFPVTSGAFQTTFGGFDDAFVTKLNGAGSALVYSTYLGGNSGDQGRGIAVDSVGSAYVTGITSTNFPTTSGAFQTTAGGSSDAFVTKLNAAGSALVYSTYLGGNDQDPATGIAVDSTGSAYVTGVTRSTNFPTTSGAFQTTYGGNFDAFVTKLNAAGSAPVYSTYLGGNDLDFGLAIAVDSAGSAYVTGWLNSTNFPTTLGAFQPTFGGNFDAFVTKLNAAGSALVYSTYLGGGSRDEGHGIAVDSAGSAYVTGLTLSTNFPTMNPITGACEGFCGMGYAARFDAFVTKLHTAGSALVYSTYLGGTDDDVGQGIAVDSSGNAYITGTTTSTDFPTIGAYQTMTQGGGDGFVTKITAPSPPTSLTLGTANLTKAGSFFEPVNTATGNYLFQKADFSIPGRGLSLTFARTYNSVDPYTGVLGHGWTHSYNILLSEGPDGSVTIKHGDGHDEFYDPAGGGNFTPRFGAIFSILVKNLDSSFTLTLKNQTQYRFGSDRKLSSITDRNGNALSFAYDVSGDLSAITDTGGRIVTLTYDESHRITLVTDPIGRTVRYAYDTDGNLVSVTDQNGGIMTFTYDASHQVKDIRDQRGNLLLSNTYDSTSRVITQTNGRGFTSTFAYSTPQTGDTTITDPRGNTTIHTHDTQFRLVQVTDANGNRMNFTYDAQNNRTTVTNQNGKTTSFNYDAQGNVTGITDPLTNLVVLTYDAKNSLLGATNARGKITTFSYDTVGNLSTIRDALGNTTIFAYNGFGQLTSKTDARANATTFGYDSLGNLNRITDALGNSSNLSYDGISRLISIRGANGHTATASYDALSRLVKITDPLANQTQFAYDSVGNLLKTTDAKGNATSYAYDAVNNLLSVTDALGKLTQYGYDANNNRVNFTNAKGNITSYGYDVLNRLSQITDPLSFLTSYAYDAVGNVLATTDANGRTNQFTYDALNRLTAISYGDGNNVAYSYDQNGNRVAMFDSHGTTAYIYDELDRLTSVNHPGGKVVACTYDAVGNRKSLTYPDGKVVNYIYDQVNRLSQANDWLARNTSYTYDAASNLTKTLYPNGASIAFSYDVANRLTKVVNSAPKLPALTLAYTLDPVGNRTKLSVNGIATTFGYDALNQLVSAQLGSLKSTWAYDAVGNRTKQTSPIATTNYSYDAADRLLSAGAITFTYDRNGNQITKATSSGTLTYSYDAANRLTRAVGPSVNGSFSYDGDGNRITQTTASGTYSYINDVAAALPVVLNEQGPDGNITYGYGLGLIEAFSSSFNFFYHYDGLGSVIALTDATGKPSAGYAYDPWGNTLITVPDSVGTKNKFRFTGEAFDPATQLYYLRARYYDSSSGRFTARDPLGGTDRLPLSKNRYTYALSSPTGYVDHSGLSALEGVSFQSFLGGPPLNLTNVGSTSAAVTTCPNCSHGFGLIGAVAALGGDIIPTVSNTPGLNTLGVTLDVLDRIDHGEDPLQALAHGTADFGISSAITAALVYVGGSVGGPVLVTFYDGLKLGAAIGSIPAVQTRVSEAEFSVLNAVFGPTRVAQWSTSPVWTFISNLGPALTRLP